MTVEADERCGTYAGAVRHKRCKEPMCEPCRVAYRDYMRDYRSKTGPGRDRWWNKTRAAALECLAQEYPERFGQLLAEARKSGPTPWDPA